MIVIIPGSDSLAPDRSQDDYDSGFIDGVLAQRHIEVPTTEDLEAALVLLRHRIQRSHGTAVPAAPKGATTQD